MEPTRRIVVRGVLRFLGLGFRGLGLRNAFRDAESSSRGTPLHTPQTSEIPIL